MNKVILIGRLTKDPEIRVTNSGKKVASFTVAVSDGKRDGQEITQFINCTAWERLAEILEMYVKKGIRVAVVGRIQNRSWDKPDGTKGYATDVVINELDILTTKAEADAMSTESDNNQSKNSQSTASKPQSQEKKKKQDDGEEEDKDSGDLPEIDVDKLNVQMPF